MLKLKNIIVPAMLIALAGCSQRVHNSQNENITKTGSDSLFITLSIKNVLKAGEKPNLKFLVSNDKSASKSFCKWHTPFEPLMSKYLDIKDQDGNEALYKGPMAKRIMPPPADSYQTVKPMDTLVSIIDLSKAYELKEGKEYTVSYNSGSISGLRPSNTVSFKLEK